MSEEARIDRMENKLDKLIDIVTELVAVQSDVRNINLRLNGHADSIKHNDERIDEIDKKIPIYDDRIKKGDWIWKIVAGIITTALLSLVIASSVGAV